MRVLVTGASGFVGQRLLPRLEDAGHTTIPTDRETDVTRRAVMDETLRSARPDAVIHLAAMSSVAQSWKQPALCYQLNFIGTRTLLEAVEAQAPDARVLLIGSADQYGASEAQPRPLSEDAPLRPRSPYARSKTAGEQLGAQAAARGLDILRIRAFNHTGAGQADHFVVSSFARQVAQIQLGKEAPRMRVGNLASVRDFLHVDDVLDAYLALLEPGATADVYNIASERATTIQEVLDRLVALAGIAPEVEVDPERFRPTDWLVGDAARLRAATDWTPRIGLDAILEELHSDWMAKER